MQALAPRGGVAAVPDLRWAKGIQTLQTKRQADIIQNMKDYTKQLHQLNYNAVVARRVADKLQV
eukprot:SAG25_NODE_284_length_10400_cov_5.110475_15_plen_63_part_01